jgi:hypothetical protein
MSLSDVRWNRTSTRALGVETNNPLLNAQGYGITQDIRIMFYSAKSSCHNICRQLPS